MLRLFREKPSMSVVDDQYGCPTNASDIAHAIVQIIHRIRRNRSISWGIYHYAGRGKTNWYGFAEKVLEIAAPHDHFMLKELHPIPTSAYPTPAKRPQNSVLDCTKIKTVFGIDTVPWEQSLRGMLERLYQTP